IRFILEANRAGLKPVIGAELEVDGHPVALLAADVRGYRNLASLVTRSRIGRWDHVGGGTGPGPDLAGPGGEGERCATRGPVPGSGVMGGGRGRPVSRPKGASAVNPPLADRYGVPIPGRGRPVL